VGYPPDDNFYEEKNPRQHPLFGDRISGSGHLGSRYVVSRCTRLADPIAHSIKTVCTRGYNGRCFRLRHSGMAEGLAQAPFLGRLVGTVGALHSPAMASDPTDRHEFDLLGLIVVDRIVLVAFHSRKAFASRIRIVPNDQLRQGGRVPLIKAKGRAM